MNAFLLRLAGFAQGRSFGELAQLGERDVRNVEVEGSTPLLSTEYRFLRTGIFFNLGRLAQLVRAPLSHGGGQQFESVAAHSTRLRVVKS